VLVLGAPIGPIDRKCCIVSEKSYLPDSPGGGGRQDVWTVSVVTDTVYVEYCCILVYVSECW